MKKTGKHKSVKTTKTHKKINPRDVRVPTGIRGFDSLIEGGLEKNSTNLLVGSSGSGKSIFSVQFLIEGIKRGEKCLYITFEENKETFFSNMADFGWDLADYERKEKLFFLEYTPEKVKTMLEEGGGAIENIVLSKKISRIIIDSITSFELLFEKEIEKRSTALALFKMIRKWDSTALLTYEGTPSQEKKSTSRILDFESDAIILLHFVRVKKQRKRYVEVLKMRGTDHSLAIHPFSIEDSGIVVSKEEYDEDFKK